MIFIQNPVVVGIIVFLKPHAIADTYSVPICPKAPWSRRIIRRVSGIGFV
jgi:hypothetical protein